MRTAEINAGLYKVITKITPKSIVHIATLALSLTVLGTQSVHSQLIWPDGGCLYNHEAVTKMNEVRRAIADDLGQPLYATQWYVIEDAAQARIASEELLPQVEYDFPSNFITRLYFISLEATGNPVHIALYGTNDYVCGFDASAFVHTLLVDRAKNAALTEADAQEREAISQGPFGDWRNGLDMQPGDPLPNMTPSQRRAWELYQEFHQRMR